MSGPTLTPKGVAYVHDGAREVGQGGVDDAIVDVCGRPLEAEDVRLAEELQEHPVVQAAPVWRHPHALASAILSILAV